MEMSPISDFLAITNVHTCITSINDLVYWFLDANVGNLILFVCLKMFSFGFK